MDSAVGASIALGPAAADVFSAVRAHKRSLHFDTPFMGISKGANSANKDAFTPPVLVQEVADDFSKRDPTAWENLTEAIWRTVCKGRDVTYRGTNVNFDKTQKPNKKRKTESQHSSSELKPSDIHGFFACVNSNEFGVERNTAKPKARALPPLTNIDADCAIGQARVGGPHTQAVLEASHTLPRSSALVTRVSAGAISARDHASSIGTAGRWFSNSACFKQHLTGAMLDRASVPKHNQSGKDLTVAQRRGKYEWHQDPIADFDFAGAAKGVFDAMDADTRTSAAGAYTRLFNLGDDSTKQRASVEGDSLCQRVLGSLQGLLPGHSWCPRDSAGAVIDPSSIVGAAVPGAGSVQIAAAQCEYGVVLTSAGNVVAPGPGIVGTVTRGLSVRRFFVLIEPKRMARSSVDLYVQGQILCGNNGKVVEERDSILAFVARRELSSHAAGLMPAAASYRDCFYQVGVDAVVQTHLLHYANLNQAMARLLLPEPFKSRVGTRTVLVGGPHQHNRVGKAGHAPCHSHFKIRYRNSLVKRARDECSCGERIRYASREAGGVPPRGTPPSTAAPGR